MSNTTECKQIAHTIIEGELHEALYVTCSILSVNGHLVSVSVQTDVSSTSTHKYADGDNCINLNLRYYAWPASEFGEQIEVMKHNV